MVRKLKVIQNPYPRPDQLQKLINSRGSPLVDAYHVYSMSVFRIRLLSCLQATITPPSDAVC